MSKDLEQNAFNKTRELLRPIINGLLAIGGIWLFVYLVAKTGVTLQMLKDFGWAGFGILLFVATLVILLDAIAWYYAVAHIKHPRFWPLFGLRIAGDSLTNGLPGGVVFGETYKAVMLRAWHKISLADNAAILLTVKFGLGFSQALFVLLGLFFCYPLLRERSGIIVGFEGAHYIALAVTIGMALFMFIPISLMFTGKSFAWVAGGIGKLPIKTLRKWLSSKQDKIEALDFACTSILHNNKKHLFLTFIYLFAGWVVSAAESYVLLYWMDLAPTTITALVMESVGSLFRLVFFMVPSGIGGQDASFLALFSLFGLPKEKAGVFILIKRFKEVVLIGVGFLLVFVMRGSGNKQQEEQTEKS